MKQPEIMSERAARMSEIVEHVKNIVDETVADRVHWSSATIATALILERMPGLTATELSNACDLVSEQTADAAAKALLEAIKNQTLEMSGLMQSLERDRAKKRRS